MFCFITQVDISRKELNPYYCFLYNEVQPSSSLASTIQLDWLVFYNIGITVNNKIQINCTFGVRNNFFFTVVEQRPSPTLYCLWCTYTLTIVDSSNCSILCFHLEFTAFYFYSKLVFTIWIYLYKMKWRLKNVVLQVKSTLWTYFQFLINLIVKQKCHVRYICIFFCNKHNKTNNLKRIYLRFY